MAQPTPYDRQFNFQNQQILTPQDPPPAQELDGEFNSVKITIDEILANIARIQRDDGRLSNGSVGSDTLDETIELGVRVPAAWLTDTNYTVLDSVFVGSKWYRCVESHASEVFADDLLAGKWSLLIDLEESIENVITEFFTAEELPYSSGTSGLGSDNVQDAIDALDAIVDAEIANRVSAVSAEATARANADVALQNDIDGEAITRAAADTTLQNNINLKANTASPTLTGVPAAPTATAGTNTTQIATTAFVSAAIAALISSAPGLLDTLDEIAAALNDDPNFAATMTTALNGKQPLSALLSSVAALTTAANKGLYTTALNTAALYDLTAYGRSLGGVADEAAFKALVNLEAGVDYQAYTAATNALAALTPAANTIPRFTSGSAAGLLSFLDEDDMASNSDTAIPSQQSVKAYVTAAVASGISDGDKGDISISGGGTVYTIDAGAVTPAKLADPTAYAGRMLQVNGCHAISQENGNTAQTSIGSAGGVEKYITDQWMIRAKGSLRVTGQRIQTSPPAGILDLLRVTITTAQSSLGSGDYLVIDQPIEAMSVVKLGFGAAGATGLTIGFFVRSSITGTFAGYVTNSARNRAHPVTFSISAANTLEWKTITITGDTSGTWLTAEGVVGLHLCVVLAAGSTFQGTNATWAGSEIMTTSSQTNLAATNSNTFDMTGFVALPGTHSISSAQAALFQRDAPDEVAKCFRYFQVHDEFWATYYGSGAVDVTCSVLPMCKTPAGSIIGTWAFVNCSSLSVWSVSKTNFTLRVAVTAPGGITFYTDSSDDAVHLNARLS